MRELKIILTNGRDEIVNLTCNSNSEPNDRMLEKKYDKLVKTLLEAEIITEGEKI